jgi:predicted GNAT family acetyltransferase
VVIKPVNFASIKPFAAAASRDRVSLSDTKGTEWFIGYDENDTIMVMAGLLKTPYGYRIKGVYVPPALRGKGLGLKITEHLLNICDERCANVEVFAYNDAFYLHLGFKAFGVLPNGATKLRRQW